MKVIIELENEDILEAIPRLTRILKACNNVSETVEIEIRGSVQA